MDIALSIFEKCLIATYTICLPIILKWIQGMKKEKAETNAYMRESVDDLKASVNTLSDKIDFNEALTCRYRIIRAADEIARGTELSKDHLEQLGEDQEIYKAFCQKTPTYKNHKGQTSMAIIAEYEKQRIKNINKQ